MTDWPLVKTSQLIKDGILEIGDGYRAKNSEMGATGLPFIRAGDVNGKVNTADCELLDTRSVVRVGNKRSRAGDVVLTTKGTVGRVAHVDTSTLEFVYSPQLCFWRSLRPDRLVPRFIFYSLQSDHLKHQMGWSSGQTDMAPYISLTDQRTAFELRLPVPEVQKQISEVLGSLDDKIELNRRMNETLEAMAQAIFRDWFVDFGPTRRKLEGATDPITIMGGLVQDTERAQALADLFPAALGDDGLPERWRLRKVGDVAARVAMGPFGSRITKDNFVERGVPVIRGKNLSSGFVDSDFVFLTPEKAIELGGSIARQEDIVFTHRGTLGQVGRIHPGSAFQEYVVSQSQLLLSVDRQQTGSRFMYYFFISDAGQRAWLANAGGAGVPAIASPTRSLKGIEFTDPGISIALEFDTLTSCLEKRVIAAKHESNTLAATRDLLLPKLMSGEIRLSQGEDLMEAAQ